MDYMDLDYATDPSDYDAWISKCKPQLLQKNVPMRLWRTLHHKLFNSVNDVHHSFNISRQTPQSQVLCIKDALIAEEDIWLLPHLVEAPHIHALANQLQTDAQLLDRLWTALNLSDADWNAACSDQVDKRDNVFIIDGLDLSPRSPAPDLGYDKCALNDDVFLSVQRRERAYLFMRLCMCV